ncbi:hypothetical protein D3C80_1908830 [compost metagenome]
MPAESPYTSIVPSLLSPIMRIGDLPDGMSSFSRYMPFLILIIVGISRLFGTALMASCTLSYGALPSAATVITGAGISLITTEDAPSPASFEAVTK